MQTTNSYSDLNLIQQLSSDGLAIVRTDTVYGILARAGSSAAVERIYQLKGRDDHKALIILVAEPSQIPGLTPELLKQYQQMSAERPTSLIMPAINQPDWLTRGGDSLAYRVPSSNRDLLRLLDITGPLVAPSANPQGLITARSIAEAKDYFTNRIDIYVDGGKIPIETRPSRLVRIYHGQIEIIRQ